MTSISSYVRIAGQPTTSTTTTASTSGTTGAGAAKGVAGGGAGGGAASSSSDSATISLAALEKQLQAIEKEIAQAEQGSNANPQAKATLVQSLNAQAVTVEASIAALEVASATSSTSAVAAS